MTILVAIVGCVLVLGSFVIVAGSTDSTPWRWQALAAFFAALGAALLLIDAGLL